MKLHWSISNLIVGTIITMMLSSTLALAQNDLTNRLISASISTLNRRELHRVPPVSDFYTLADKMDAATEASSRDGSLLLEEHRIWENSRKIVEQAPDRHAIYQRLRARGWKGSWEDTEKMASATRDDRYRAVREIQRDGLRAYQHHIASGLRKMADKMANDYHLLLLPEMTFCSTWNGIFIGSIALGGVLSLGGIDPWGDALVAFGGIGLFGEWLAC